MPLPAHPSHLQKIILDYLEETGHTVASLERVAGLRMNVARNILRGVSKRPTTQTLQALADVMNCSVNHLMGKQAPQKAKETPLSHPDLLLAALNALLEQTQGNTLSLQETLERVAEIYSYSVKKNPPQIDHDFVRWTLEREEAD